MRNILEANHVEILGESIEKKAWTILEEITRGASEEIPRGTLGAIHGNGRNPGRSSSGNLGNDSCRALGEIPGRHCKTSLKRNPVRNLNENFRDNV